MKKRFLPILGMLLLLGLVSCHQAQKDNALISRNFPTASWERFDFVERTVTLDKPVSYDLELEATFDDTYPFDYFSVVFTVFDDADRPLRSRNYRFNLKNRDGAWKSEPENGLYHFLFPINNDLSLNEPGTYKFQIENHMPITPLVGIHQISIIDK